MQGKRIIVNLDGRTARISREKDLYQGGRQDNDVVVELIQRGKPAKVSGYVVSGEFERSDGARVLCVGTMNGNVATIKLDEHCYYREGAYRMTVRLSKRNGETTHTVLEITGTVKTRCDEHKKAMDEKAKEIKHECKCRYCGRKVYGYRCEGCGAPV